MLFLMVTLVRSRLKCRRILGWHCVKRYWVCFVTCGCLVRVVRLVNRRIICPVSMLRLFVMR